MLQQCCTKRPDPCPRAVASWRLAGVIILTAASALAMHTNNTTSCCTQPTAPVTTKKRCCPLHIRHADRAVQDAHTQAGGTHRRQTPQHQSRTPLQGHTVPIRLQTVYQLQPGSGLPSSPEHSDSSAARASGSAKQIKRIPPPLTRAPASSGELGSMKAQLQLLSDTCASLFWQQYRTA